MDIVLIIFVCMIVLVLNVFISSVGKDIILQNSNGEVPEFTHIIRYWKYYKYPMLICIIPVLMALIFLIIKLIYPAFSCIKDWWKWYSDN